MNKKTIHVITQNPLGFGNGKKEIKSKLRNPCDGGVVSSKTTAVDNDVFLNSNVRLRSVSQTGRQLFKQLIDLETIH